MKLKNILLVVEDLEKSKAFYEKLFSLRTVSAQEGNVVLTEGVCLQERAVWESCVAEPVLYQGNDAELYFEENDMAGFQQKLEEASFDIEYITPFSIEPWGQKIVRIYDPDRHVIEVAESMEYVRKRNEEIKKDEKNDKGCLSKTQ